MAIKDWPADERPREKLLQQGPSVLTDAELLAIFLRTGVTGLSAVDMAKGLLDEFGSLRAMLAADESQFCQAHGLGQAKYAQLQAVVEMTRRYLREELQHGRELTDPTAVGDYLRCWLRDKPYEVFVALFLDTRHRLIRVEELFRGTLDTASVYPREVARAALQYNAAAVILAHNHPSGVAEPSMADRNITTQLVSALQTLDVRVLDHLVVGDAEVQSFAARGWL